MNTAKRYLYCYYNINKRLILSCSSNVIPVYGYHLTGEWTGVPSGGMDYGMDDGMYSWWYHSALDSFVPSYRSQRIDIFC